MGKKLKSEVLLDEIREEWDGIKALQHLVVEVEDREYTADEVKRIDETLDRVREIEVQVEKERKEESVNKSIDDLDQIFKREPKGPNPPGTTTPPGQAGQKSLGQRFTDSPEWKAFLEAAAPNGHFPEKSRLTSHPIQVKSLLAQAGYHQKTLITGASDASAGAFVVPEDTGIYEPLGRYPLTLRQLIDVRRTTSDSVEFVRQLTQVTQAVPVAEANVTEYSGASGEISGEKPEGAMTFERVQELVKTIAVWIPATRRALADVAQLRGLIDAELLADTMEELENQLLNGNGVGENFTGLNNTANVLVQTFVTDIAVTARKAITNLLINGRQIPTAYLFNPQDWEAYDLLQDNEGRYYWGGPMVQGPRTLWGVPVAQSFWQAQGTGWLGNWRKMVLWDREDGTISATDSHEDFFVRNLVAILAELRAAMGVIRPTAFVEMDLEEGS